MRLFNWLKPTDGSGIRIAILYVCTGAYHIFWEDFYISSEKHFIAGAQKHYFVLTDQYIDFEQRERVHKIHQPNLGWPDNTLKRFHMFSRIQKQLIEFDYIFFFNANCQFHSNVDRSFLPSDEEQLLVVNHLGFYNKEPDAFTYDRNPDCEAYIPFGSGKHYVSGAVNGGTSEAYLKFVNYAKEAVDRDEHAGHMALWHDESHLNRYVLDKKYKLLDSGYLYPEGWTLPFKKYIESRDKNRFGGHHALRNAKV